jgi:glycosyltransferase involved in cell wall biosynthesis
MKVYAICLVKNEIDVVEYCLRSASRWAEKIIVYDNGSTDGTWELVQELAVQNPTIIAWKQDGKPFYEGLRGEAFQAFRHLAQEGDWWCFRLDADEIYPEDPRPQLQATSDIYHVVAKKSVDYVLTPDDIKEHDFSQLLPVNFDNIRHYLPKPYTEVRFFRHRNRLQWEAGRDMPKHIGIVSPEKILVLHYQYRSIPQLIKRIKTRFAARQNGFVNWEFADNPDWQNILFNPTVVEYDRKDGQLLLQDSPPKRMHKLHTYLIKRVLHGLKILP